VVRGLAGAFRLFWQSLGVKWGMDAWVSVVGGGSVRKQLITIKASI